VWQISGIEGYERFASDETVRTSSITGFGAAIKLTTPKEPLIHFGERRRLAVMTFDNPGLSEDIARTTSYLLEGKLGNSPFVELVERNQIQEVLEELRYQQAGLTTSNAAEVGRHLNAEFILLGSINKLGNLLIITSKLVNVETAQIEGTREVQCSNATIENISDMVSVLAPTIAKY
jgi:TolB-like protein